MNLYEFNLSRRNGKITRDVLEVEEKPKRYIVRNGRWATRIRKSGIGKVFGRGQLFLLEDDTEKAKEIFSKKINEEIGYTKERIRSPEKDILQLDDLLKTLNC